MERILNWIEDIKEAFARLKSKEALAAYNYAHKAETLYLNAIKEAGDKYEKRRIVGIRNTDENEENIDTATQDEYNKNAPEVQKYSAKIADYYSYSDIGEENVWLIRNELYKLYEGISDGVVDGIAIERGATFYIVYSGIEDREISFGFRK